MVEEENVEKLYGYTTEEWVLAVLDILDGNSFWHEIRYHTGLSEDRCKELEKMFHEATKEGWPTSK